MSEEYERSSGNVFADLGHPDADAALAKAELTLRVKAAIQGRGWTREQAATALSLDQERFAALTRGRLSGFTTDELIHLLTRLNLDVEISIGPNVSTARPARVSVRGQMEPIAASQSRPPSEPVRFD